MQLLHNQNENHQSKFKIKLLLQEIDWFIDWLIDLICECWKLWNPNFVKSCMRHLNVTWACSHFISCRMESNCHDSKASVEPKQYWKIEKKNHHSMSFDEWIQQVNVFYTQCFNGLSHINISFLLHSCKNSCACVCQCTRIHLRSLYDTFE